MNTLLACSSGSLRGWGWISGLFLVAPVVPLFFAIGSLLASNVGDIAGAMLALPSFVISTSLALAAFHLNVSITFWIAAAAAVVSFGSFSLWLSRCQTQSAYPQPTHSS